MRESRLDEGVEESQVPAVAQYLPPILAPPKIVGPNLAVCLKGGGTLLDQPHMVDQQDCSQQQGGNVNRPEKYCHLDV